MCAFIYYLGKSLAIFMMAKADVSIQFQVMFIILTMELFMESSSMWALRYE